MVCLSRTLDGIYKELKAVADVKGMNRIFNFIPGGLVSKLTKRFDDAVSLLDVSRFLLNERCADSNSAWRSR